MSGHSKWSTIKHQKGQKDARRGQLFTKLAREITVAARKGDPDISMNPSLRLAVDRARKNSMPNDNIDRAIKRANGIGGEGGADLDEVTYEGYGPGGAAILVVALTDNRNRAASEVRRTFDRHNCKMAEVGSVSWIFDQKGVITIQETPEKAEELALLAIDLGAEDFSMDDSGLELQISLEQFEGVRIGLEQQCVTLTNAELSMVPKTATVLNERTSEQTLKLLDRLEELEDVQQVYTNAEFSAEVLENYKELA